MAWGWAEGRQHPAGSWMAPGKVNAAEASSGHLKSSRVQAVPNHQGNTGGTSHSHGQHWVQCWWGHTRISCTAHPIWCVKEHSAGLAAPAVPGCSQQSTGQQGETDAQGKPHPGSCSLYKNSIPIPKYRDAMPTEPPSSRQPGTASAHHAQAAAVSPPSRSPGTARFTLQTRRH